MINRPSGRNTRANSASIRGWSAAGKCSIVSNDTATSTLESAIGSDAGRAFDERDVAAGRIRRSRMREGSRVDVDAGDWVAVSASNALP
jgi:hypothetical protein